MSDFAVSWRLCRQRFLDTISDLNQDQLNWRLHKDALTIAEMAVHVAGVEVSFSSQLLQLPLSEELQRVKSCATDGVVNDKPFPFTAQELTPEFVAKALHEAKEMTEPMINNPGDAVLEREIVSALGPVINGEGALARLGFHAGYHQGQAYLIRTAPGFPA